MVNRDEYAFDMVFDTIIKDSTSDLKNFILKGHDHSIASFDTTYYYEKCISFWNSHKIGSEYVAF